MSDNIFQTYRAYTFANAHKEHIVKNRDLMKETLIWNVEKGLELYFQIIKRLMILKIS